MSRFDGGRFSDGRFNKGRFSGRRSGPYIIRESDGTVTISRLPATWRPRLTREANGTITVEN